MACIHADKLVSLKSRAIFVCFGPGEKEEDLDVKPSSAGLDRRARCCRASGPHGDVVEEGHTGSHERLCQPGYGR
jgi:hypothetical protein